MHGTHPTGIHSCFTSVCDSFCSLGEGGGLPLSPGGVHTPLDTPPDTPTWTHTHRHPLVTHTTWTPPMVNKRPVRILLEFFLVYNDILSGFLFYIGHPDFGFQYYIGHPDFSMSDIYAFLLKELNVMFYIFFPNY